jgi:hypothetical protein
VNSAEELTAAFALPDARARRKRQLFPPPVPLIPEIRALQLLDLRAAELRVKAALITKLLISLSPHPYTTPAARINFFSCSCSRLSRLLIEPMRRETIFAPALRRRSNACSFPVHYMPPSFARVFSQVDA